MPQICIAVAVKPDAVDQVRGAEYRIALALRAMAACAELAAVLTKPNNSARK
jgi:hypothetical protein